MSELPPELSVAHVPPTKAAILNIGVARVPDIDLPVQRLHTGGPVNDLISLYELVTPTEPSIGVGRSIAAYAGRLAVDVEACSAILRDYGQSEAESRALRVSFVDGKRIAAQAKMPPGIGIGAWHEPLGMRYQWTGENTYGYDVFPNYIGMPVNGPEDMTPAGLKLLNDLFRHELGHCATRQYPLTPSLYHSDEDGRILPYWNKRVFGVVPVVAAVGFLRMRGQSEFEALWRLDKKERQARAFEAAHPDFSPITLSE